MTPQDQYSINRKAAQAQYARDKKLCDGESVSLTRLQCRRDAKTEYERAIAQAKTMMNAVNRGKFIPAAAACAGCGKVVSVTELEKPGEGSAVGILGGGTAGAILANQTHTVWNVGVKYDDGSRGNVEFDHDPGFKVGDAVKRSGDTLVK